MSKVNKLKNILQAPKGMHDILPEDYIFYQNVFEKSEDIASYYGFQPIQTPHVEKNDLFTISIGASTDVVEKQIYSLKPKGGDHLVLRPEGTASIMRAYIEHGLHTLPQPVMLWYKGSFFRYERPQRGRFREMQQFGLEIIGEQKPVAEAIIIKILILILEELGLGPMIVRINSLGDRECRHSYRRELVNYYRKKINHLCKDCKKRLRTNPLRILDCKDPKCIEMKKDAPQMIDYLCPLCNAHFREVLEFLDASEIPYFLDSHIVRGLDYYSRTVFEIFEDRTLPPEDEETKIMDALGAGGRYDDLAKTLGKKDFPAVGGALGVDRIVMLMKEKNIKPRQKRNPKVYLIQLGAAAKYKSIKIIEMLRRAHVPLIQSISKDNLRGQLAIASKLNIPYVLIVGQKEALENSIIIRDMNSGNQETVPIEEVVEIIKGKI